MKNILILFSLVFVIFLSGCTLFQPAKQPTAAANGVIIKSLAPDFEEIRSGEFIDISLTAENIGEAEATGVKAQLFGLNPEEWKLATGQNWTQEVASLKPAYPAQKLAGESYEFTWSLTSPPNLKVDNEYTADARVYFKYSTSALATLRFLSNDYLKSLPATEFEKMKKTAGVVQSTVSGAPVQVSITAGVRPLIVYKDEERYSIQLIISNVGSGNPFYYGASYPPVGQEDLYKVNVSIKTAGDKPVINCPLIGGKTGVVTLTRGKSKTLFCDVTVKKADFINSVDYTIDILLNYGYYVDSSTTVKVLRAESL